MKGDKARERVLVLGDDMRIFLAVVRSLGRAGKEVHGAPFNWHSPALSSKYLSKVHHIPRYPDDPRAWRASMSRLLKTHAFDLIVPCCDRAIMPFHLHRGEFAQFPIAIPGPEAVGLLFDKERTRQLSAELGIPVADGVRLAASDTAQGLADRFGLPLVLKPRQSYWTDQLDSWGKVWIVESVPELEKLLGDIPDPSRYLVEALFQGEGVGVSVLADEGRLLHAFQHRRLREGRGGSSSYRVSEPVDKELHGACEKIAARTKLTGVCMFEFRYNRSNRDWILLETNARFWGSLPLPLSLGVDFPRYLFDLVTHRAMHAPVEYARGVRSRNLVLDGFNLFAGLRRLQWGQFGPWIGDLSDFVTQPIRWLTGRERSDSFVRDDVWPGVWECALLLRSLGQKIVRSRSTPLNRRRVEKDLGNAASKASSHKTLTSQAGQYS